MDRFFSRLQRMLERKSRLYWNKWYFSKYIEDNITPWGLRIQIFPTLHNVDLEFKTEWEEALQICSARMMSLLCKHYTADLTILDHEIEKLYEENNSIVQEELFSTRESTLKADLENYVSALLKNKEQKFIRDKLSYDNSQAYNWGSSFKDRKRMGNKNPKKTYRQSEAPTDATESDSSLSSTSVTSMQDQTAPIKTHGFFQPKPGRGNNRAQRQQTRGQINTRAAVVAKNSLAESSGSIGATSGSANLNPPKISPLLAQPASSTITNAQQVFRLGQSQSQPIVAPKN